MPSDVPIAYAAHTATCTFLLDAEGFCRRVMTRNKHHKESRVARRCLGAQYVASLDLRSEAGLVEMPTPGAAMIFARIDDGRVALVKTAPLERFDERDEAPPSRPSSAVPVADPYEDDEMDGRTRQVRAVRDAGAANPELSRKYQELLDRAARPARAGASGGRRGRTGEHAAVDVYAAAAVSGTELEPHEPDEPYEADGPTLFRRAPQRAQPQPQPGKTGERRGMLPKRAAVLASKTYKPGSGDR